MRRPGEGRDPYAVSVMIRKAVVTFWRTASSQQRRQRLWVPAFAGTTLRGFRLRSIPRRDAWRQNGFEVFGAVAVGVHQEFVGDAAQLAA